MTDLDPQEAKNFIQEVAKYESPHGMYICTFIPPNQTNTEAKLAKLRIAEELKRLGILDGNIVIGLGRKDGEAVNLHLTPIGKDLLNNF